MFWWHKRKTEHPLAAELSQIPAYPPELFTSHSIAIGGLSEIGFSRQYPHLLLVISSSGRGVIDCRNGEKIARDTEAYGEWYDPILLTCKGIGPLIDETVTISGQCGGGLPLCNHRGETLTRVAPGWPEETLFWNAVGRDVLYDKFRQNCYKLTTDYFHSAGYSWNGEFIVSATSSDLTIWQKN
ncbi:hypothetical protein VW41_12960 [Klebsiella michiganensis]|nr:hypothetical protein VW41_12960 [Klebsiella michiganensis]